MDKSWIHHAIRVDPVYRKGCKSFLDFAFANNNGSSRIYCPCKRCLNIIFAERDVVEEHIIINGFNTKYTNWTYHGEIEEHKHEKAKGGEVGRMDVFAKTHSQKHTKPSYQAAGEKIGEMTNVYERVPKEEHINEKHVQDSIYDQIMGPDKHGLGVFPTQLSGSRLSRRTSKSSMASLREEVGRQVVAEVKRRVGEEMKKVYKRLRVLERGSRANANNEGILNSVSGEVDQPAEDEVEGLDLAINYDGDDEEEEIGSVVNLMTGQLPTEIVAKGILISKAKNTKINEELLGDGYWAVSIKSVQKPNYPLMKPIGRRLTVGHCLNKVVPWRSSCVLMNDSVAVGIPGHLSPANEGLEVWN